MPVSSLMEASRTLKTHTMVEDQMKDGVEATEQNRLWWHE